ncbi:MAG: hypothetical protein K6348_05515 [Deferribacterales bacterium]
MVIESGTLNNVLRTYNKQIRYGKISSIVDKPTSSTDKVSLSPEAKKMILFSAIVSESDKEIDTEELKRRLENIDFSKITEQEMEKLKKDIIATL